MPSRDSGLAGCSSGRNSTMAAIAAPVAWYMGNAEVVAIDAGRRDPSNRGTAKAAKIIGIVGTVLAVLGIIGYGVLVVLAN